MEPNPSTAPTVVLPCICDSAAVLVDSVVRTRCCCQWLACNPSSHSHTRTHVCAFPPPHCPVCSATPQHINRPGSAARHAWVDAQKDATRSGWVRGWWRNPLVQTDEEMAAMCLVGSGWMAGWMAGWSIGRDGWDTGWADMHGRFASIHPVSNNTRTPRACRERWGVVLGTYTGTAHALYPILSPHSQSCPFRPSGAGMAGPGRRADGSVE